MENELTQKYISQYGLQHVRGGEYIFKYLNFQQPSEALHRKKKDGAYLLQLTEGKYFAGHSQDMEADIDTHFKNKGSVWTNKYPPQTIVKKIKIRKPETAKALTL